MRYVMANLTSRRLRHWGEKYSRSAIDEGIISLSSEQIVSDSQTTKHFARRIVTLDVDPEQLYEMKASLSEDVVIEPEILHYHDVIRPAELIGARTQRLPQGSAADKSLKIKINGTSQPVEGAKITLFLKMGRNFRQMNAKTDSAGEYEFRHPRQYTPFAFLADPPFWHWNKLIRDVFTDSLEITLTPLPNDPGPYWWSSLCGVVDGTPSGQGVRVGVIDTGCGPHAGLQHVNDEGAYVGSSYDPNGGDDVDSHGSHVAGTIGARTSAQTSYEGISPEVDLYTVRVFPPEEGAGQQDIISAIDHLTNQCEVDLINMSFGASQPSLIEEDSILDANEKGTLCICAAGNDAGNVRFPAGFDVTAAVSAVGRLGWAPENSLSGQRLPQEAEKFGDEQTYLANFSNFGQEIICTAPGVGIIAPVPERFGSRAPLAAYDGTSMSAPIVTAVLARLLSADTQYLDLPRDATRSDMAMTLLRSACKDLGLQMQHQGRGLPRAS